MKEDKKGKQCASDKATTQDALANLERCVAKMAHYSGQERVLDEFDIPRWTPGRNDMRKFKD